MSEVAKCRACGRAIYDSLDGGAVNRRDALCGYNRGAKQSCTMRCFLFGERLKKWVRPVERSFWTSPEWLVGIDEWLEAGQP